MGLAEISQIVVASLLSLVAMGRALDWIKGKRNGNNALALSDLLDSSREQTSVLREIKDRLIALDHRQDKANDSLIRVESSLSAAHRRLDGVAGGGMR